MNDSLHRLTDAIVIQQDYAWFVCVVVWTGVAWFTHRAGRDANLGWLFTLSVSQAVLGAWQIARMVHVPASAMTPWRGWEWGSWIGLATALIALSFRISRTAGGLTAVATCAALGWHLTRPLVFGPAQPIEGALAVVLIAAVVAWATVRKNRRQPVAGLAVAVLIGAICSVDGAWAETVFEARRWSELSLFTLPAIGCSLAGAWCALAVASRTSDQSDPRVPERRRLFLSLAACLALGFGLALASGELARRAFEQNLLSRAQTAVLALDTPVLERWLRDELRLGKLRVGRTWARRPIESYEAPAIDHPNIQPLRAYLKKVHDLSDGIRFVHISVLRGDEIIVAVYRRVEHDPRGIVIRFGMATETDRREWAAQRPHVLPPIVGPRGALVQARSPILGSDGKIIAWFGLDASYTRWIAEQARARLLVLAAVSLGLALLLLAERHRERTGEKLAAEREAIAERAANQAKGAFLAQISHELRTPIQSVLGYGELLRGTGLNAAQRRWAEAQSQHGELLLRLVNDLLDSFSLQNGVFRLDPRPGELGPALAEAVRIWQERARNAESSLVFESGGPAVTLLFDAGRVRQVVNNLVGNAVKFAPGGRIRTNLTVTAADDDWVEAEFKVADDGPGLGKDEQARLFQPFVRLQGGNHQEGSGLGLAISRGLCRAMGGDLTVESDGRKGSTFIARWRLKRSITPVSLAPALAPTSPRSLHGLRILVADDNALVRELFIEGLRAAGAEVFGAADGTEALARGQSEPFDAIVLDLSMPGLQGDDVARLLRRSHPALRLVGVSAHADSADRDRAIRAGMDGFLVKPARLPDLVALIRPGAEITTGTSASELLMRLHREFLSTRPALVAAMVGARERRDWAELARRAHHLKSSADLLQLPDLSAACAALYAVAETDEDSAEPAADLALHKLLTALDEVPPEYGNPTASTGARFPV